MILRILRSDVLKLRRKMVLFLIVLGPAGVILLQALNFGLRYDYIMNYYKADLWGGLLSNIILLAVPTMFMGLAIIASMLANIEHQTNAWKQMLALPVSRFEVYTSKLLLMLILLFGCIVLLGIGTVCLGLALGMPFAELHYMELVHITLLPFLAILPFLALQVWLSHVIPNQAIPLTVGILGAVLSFYAPVLPDWVPWKWPFLENEWNEPMYFVALGLAGGLLQYLLGLTHFVRKDVN